MCLSRARWVAHGYARAADAAETLDLLAAARERGLVQFGENVRENVGFVCNCCGCCCEAMIASRKLGPDRMVHTTRWQPAVAEETYEREDPHDARAARDRGAERTPG